MPRRARLTVLDVPHHVCQAAAGNENLFFTEEDRAEYLAALREEADYYRLDIVAYCLLRDRVNLVLIPRQRDALSKTIGRTHFWYAQYINRRRTRTGKLWHDRFHSCPVDPERLADIVRYVESIPLHEAGLRKPEKYDFSSAAAHISGEDAQQVLDMETFTPPRPRQAWAQTLARKMDDSLREEIRLHTQTGRPWGSEHFVAGLEKKFRRRLHALPVGRPSKNSG